MEFFFVACLELLSPKVTFLELYEPHLGFAGKHYTNRLLNVYKTAGADGGAQPVKL